MSTVFFDIDTQLDFLYPAGALYVPGAEHIIEHVAQLNRYAASHQIPVVSTVDAHTEDDPEFKLWPPHCVAGTAGQQKPSATLLEKRLVIRNTASDLSPVVGAQQIILEKQSVDCFTCVNLTALLRRLSAARCVVYGVVTEICVKNAALGLLRSGLRVEIAADAVRSLNDAVRDQFLAEFQSAGGTLTRVSEVTTV